MIVLFFGANVPKDYDAGKMDPSRTFGAALETFLDDLDPDRRALVLMRKGRDHQKAARDALVAASAARPDATVVGAASRSLFWSRRAEPSVSQAT